MVFYNSCGVFYPFVEQRTVEKETKNHYLMCKNVFDFKCLPSCFGATISTLVYIISLGQICPRVFYYTVHTGP